MDEKDKEKAIEYNLRGCKICCEAQGDCKMISGTGGQKFATYDWLENIQDPEAYNIYEIQFKNTRKGFYVNINDLNLRKGDIVAVEASPGHDIGIVSLCGNLVKRQIKKKGIDLSRYEFKKIYRKARATDIEKWQEAIALEHATMIKSRQIAASLGLNMKIGDVEYQGDKTKAIFYYIADERVDFRELIKVLAEQFHIRIEMKQIGARQEAGLIGGIGPCGRELCCAQWLGNFVSVTTGTARYQDISPNPQKLAGQCCKLKCCLNYELDMYMDAQKDFPRINTPLELKDGKAYLVKTDVLKRMLYFSYGPEGVGKIIPLPAERVKELLALNRRGIKIDNIEDEKVDTAKQQEETPDFKNVVGEDSITRFDKSKKRKNQNRNRKPNQQQAQQGQQEQTAQPATDGKPRNNRPPRMQQNRNKNRNQNQNTNKDTKAQPQNKQQQAKPKDEN